MTGIQGVRFPSSSVASAWSATWCCHESAVSDMGGAVRRVVMCGWLVRACLLDVRPNTSHPASRAIR